MNPPRPAGTLRSFRDLLALRFALITTGGMVLCVVGTFVVLQRILDAELDANILNVASIQAAAVTDAASGAMEFHEWNLTPQEASSIRELVRYAQVWSADGGSLLRSQYMTGDLPTDALALQTASDGELVWRESDFEGAPIRSVFYPLVRLGDLHEHHVLQVAAPLATRNTMLGRVGIFGVILVLLTGIGSVFGGRWLAARALRPVTDIIDQAEDMGAGTLRRRISAYADTREYQRLVQVLNTMLDRIQAGFESQRRFTADASHELRTPLTAMRGELELALRRERSGTEYREVLGSAHEEVMRLSRIVEGLLTMARSDSGVLRPRLEPSDLREAARQAVDRAGIEADGAGVRLEFEAPESLPGLFDADLLVQMIGNLVGNALRFAGEDGTVRVSLERTGTVALVRVEDSGPGLPPGSEERVFERFWRADPSRTAHQGGAGTGLGLAIVKVIVEAHGGSVTVAPRSPLGGAAFEVGLPLGHLPDSPLPTAADHARPSRVSV